MHRCVCDNDKRPGDDGQPNDIAPHGERIESECTQYGCTRHFDVQTVFVVNQSEICDFVDDQPFKAVMENR